MEKNSTAAVDVNGVIVNTKKDSRKEMLCPVGKSVEKQDIFFAPDTHNFSCALGGGPGTAKTSTAYRLADMRVEHGEKIIIIAHHGSDQNNIWVDQFYEKHKERLTLIDASEDEVTLPLVPVGVSKNPEKGATILTYALNTPLGIRKDSIKLLHEAAEEAIRYGDLDKEGVDALIKNLRALSSARAEEVASKLDQIYKIVNLHIGLFPADKQILVYDLNGLPNKTQMVLLELIIQALRSEAENGLFCETGCTVLLDEAQYVNYDKGSPLIEALQVLRKQGLSFILASPEVPYEKKTTAYAVSSLVGAMLFFHPGAANCSKYVSFMDVPKTMQHKVAMRLNRLKTGHCIAKGPFVVNGSVDRINIVELAWSTNDESIKEGKQWV